MAVFVILFIVIVTNDRNSSIFYPVFTFMERSNDVKLTLFENNQGQLIILPKGIMSLLESKITL